MDVKFDSTNILFGAGAILGVVASIYFAQEIIFGLSPITRSLSLFIAFSMFFILGNSISEKILGKFLYFLSAATYTVFLIFTISKFDFSSNQVFTVLLFSSFLFIGLGYAVKKRDRIFSDKLFRLALLILTILLFSFLIFDIVGAQPVYNLRTFETVDLEEGVSEKVGAVEINNDFVLPRDYDAPSYRGCFFIEEDVIEVSVRYSDYSLSSGVIVGKSSLEADIEVFVRDFQDLNVTKVEAMSIRSGDKCPEEYDEGTLHIFQNSDLPNAEIPRPVR